MGRWKVLETEGHCYYQTQRARPTLALTSQYCTVSSSHFHACSRSCPCCCEHHHSVPTGKLSDVARARSLALSPAGIAWACLYYESLSSSKSQLKERAASELQPDGFGNHPRPMLILEACSGVVWERAGWHRPKPYPEAH